MFMTFLYIRGAEKAGIVTHNGYLVYLEPEGACRYRCFSTDLQTNHWQILLFEACI